MHPFSVEYARRVRSLFEEASELSFDARIAFLEESCGGDETLRRDVEALLDQTDDGESNCEKIFEHAIKPGLEALGENPSILNELDDPESPSASSEVDPMLGRTVSHFEIIAPLGKGGMGVIYEARDRDLDRTVALKFLPAELHADRNAKDRFTNEAKAASALDHANIATVYEIGETDSNQLFIAMGYYSGESLKQRIGHGPLPVETALDIFSQLAKGLAKAHALGLIHRDIKPGNIMVTDDGVVKLLDFGVAKLADVSMHTQAGQMIGTIAYMSPEQIQGVSVDQRSDIWSMGVVLHEMLTGRRPFGGDQVPAVIQNILDREFVPPKGVDSGLSMILRVCLAKDPAHRYSSIDDLLEDVQRVREGLLPIVKPVGKKLPSLSRWRIPALGTAAALAIVSTIVLLREPPSTPDHPVVPQTAGGIIDSIAVLPFSNLSGDPDSDFFVDGMHDGTITQLARMGTLEIVSRSSTLRYRDTDQSLKEVATALGVGALLVGSVQQSDERVRVTTELIDAETNRLLWAESYDRTIPAEGISAFESEFAEAIAAAVHAVLSPEPDPGDAALPTANLAALEEYYRGRTAQSLDNRTGRIRALDHYRRAADLDPEFALAQVRMAEILLTQIDTDGAPFRPKLDAVEPLLETALNLDPLFGAAHVALGRLQWLTGDLKQARLSFRRAIELDPDNADAFKWLGDLMIRVYYRADLARPLLESAIALDPDRYGDRLILGPTLFIRTRWDEAERIVELELKRHPDNAEAHFLSGLLHHYAYNNLPEAMARYRKVLALEPGRIFSYLSGPTSAPDQISALYAHLGNMEAASLWAELALKLNPDSVISDSQSGLVDQSRSGSDFLRADQAVSFSTAFKYASATRLLDSYMKAGRSDLALDFCRSELPRLLNWQSASEYEEILTAVQDPSGEGRGMVGRLDPLKSPDDCQNVRVELGLSDSAQVVSAARSSSESTLYLRVAHPSLQSIAGRLDHFWGLASSGDSTYDDMNIGYNTFSVQSAWQQNAFMQVRDDERFVDLGDVPLDKDTFYELWYVVDHDRKTFDLYIKGGRQFPVQTLVSANAGFRLKTDNPLDLFRLNCHVLDATDPLYFDDIHMDPNGRNLSRPGDDWVVVEDFEDGDCSDWRISLDWAVPMSSPQLAYLIASVLQATGDDEQANRIFDQIIEIGEVFNRMLGDVLFAICQAHGVREDREKVLEWFGRMLGVGYCVRGLADAGEFAFLREDPDFLALTTEMEDRLDEQSARILEMEDSGEFEPLPALP